jgi:hypothetical protein
LLFSTFTLLKNKDFAILALHCVPKITALVAPNWLITRKVTQSAPRCNERKGDVLNARLCDPCGPLRPLRYSERISRDTDSHREKTQRILKVYELKTTLATMFYPGMPLIT